jgi:hypothetical protein
MRRTYKNKPEEAFCQWIEAQGYYPITRGWPDFFCRNPVDKQFQPVAKISALSDRQRF